MSTRFQSKKGDRPENIEVFCNECDEIISEEDKNTINCDLCRKWYHKGCTTIKTTEWKALSSNPNILYSCDICLEKKGNEATEGNQRDVSSSPTRDQKTHDEHGR